jgi:hypothetical protein
LKKRRGRIGEVSNVVGVKLFEKARSYLAKMKNIALVDTQAIRAKLLQQLEGLLDLAIAIAKGKVKQFCDQDSNEYDVTRRLWGR